MLGHLMEWFYSGLAGIQQASDSKGYEHIVINPSFVGDILWVNASYKSINGEITCRWKRDNGSISLEVSVPANTRATIVFPQADPGKITEKESPINDSEIINNIIVRGDKTCFDIPSGNYSFISVQHN
jgi:hypothetical protein